MSVKPKLCQTPWRSATCVGAAAVCTAAPPRDCDGPAAPVPACMLALTVCCALSRSGWTDLRLLVLQACSRHHNSIGPGVPQPECCSAECDPGRHGARLHVCRLLAPHRRHLHHHSGHPCHLQALWPVLQVQKCQSPICLLLSCGSCYSLCACGTCWDAFQCGKNFDQTG